MTSKALRADGPACGTALRHRRSRREQNRQDTTRALIDAAYEMLREHDFDDLTVEAVADRAGVSRRTFFNYFPSLADALTATVELVLSSAVDSVQSLPQGLPVMETAQQALERITSEGELERVAYLHYRAETSDTMRAAGLLIWEKARRELAASFSQRDPEADPLETAVMVEAIVGALYAAFRIWSSELTGEPTSADTGTLIGYLARSLEIVGRGAGG